MGAEADAVGSRVQHGAKRSHAGHVFGPRAQAGLLAAAAHEGRIGRPVAHIQHADALGRIQLVARKRGVVDPGVGQRQRHLAKRLDAVDHPVGGAGARLQHGANAVQVGNDAGFIVGGHGADHRCARRQFAQDVEVVAAHLVDRQRAQHQIGAQQPVPVRQALRHRLVLGRAVDQQIARVLALQSPLAHRAQRRQDGALDAFGRAAGKTQAPVAHAEQLAGARAHRVEHGFRAQAGRMRAAGVAESFAHGHAGRRDGSGQDR